jgi:hypothetical protein
MYVVNVDYYFHNFKRFNKCATMKTDIAIKNGRSLKLRQTRVFHLCMPPGSTPIATNEQHPWQVVGLREEWEWAEREGIDKRRRGRRGRRGVTR